MNYKNLRDLVKAGIEYHRGFSPSWEVIHIVCDHILAECEYCETPYIPDLIASHYYFTSDEGEQPLPIRYNINCAFEIVGRNKGITIIYTFDNT